jgi:hypothetical protein
VADSQTGSSRKTASGLQLAELSSECEAKWSKSVFIMFGVCKTNEGHACNIALTIHGNQGCLDSRYVVSV